MSNEWHELIKRYANGRHICNCGQAYYSEGGTYWKTGDGWPPKEYYDGLYCKYGCQANQYDVKDEIAKLVLEELEGKK